MNMDFKIVDGIEVHFKGQVYDLHNDYKFSGIVFKGWMEPCILYWRGDNEIRILCSEVSHLTVIGGIEESIGDEASLGFIGYALQTDPENTISIFEEQPEIDCDLMFTFGDNRAIKVRCSNVRLQINKLIE